MEPVRSFSVRVRLPEALEPLREIALDLGWIWDPKANELFRRIDPEWDLGLRDPVRLLGSLTPDRAEELARDDDLLALARDVRDGLATRRTQPAWFQRERPDGVLGTVAYFSPEFGVAEAIPQYSGGLGALAGDHLKAASDLGIPLVGVGLLYHHGYFRQELDPEGWQQERYPTLDPHAMALTPVPEGDVRVRIGELDVTARIWRAWIGRVPLYLLDANLEENAPEARGITDRLYGGGQEHRVRQEILLGVGGVRALESLGIRPSVYHMNEGHAGFLALERIRRSITDDDLSFPEAVERVRAGAVFTTHTSVPAGIDRFPREVIERHFGAWASECGVEMDELMSVGQWPGDPPDAPFNMALMGFRLSGWSNGVSRLHGRVSRALFTDLWPDLEPDETPIGDVTNGVHGRSWVSSAMEWLLSERIGVDWPQAPRERWSRIRDVDDADLWDARGKGRRHLVDFVRRRLRVTHRTRGAAEWDLGWCDEVLDPEVLTIGFSRRFAGYKRATLLLSQPERLKRLLTSADRPVQLLFAGKAHPADEGGKGMIREIVRFAREPEVWRWIGFVEDYDIALARALYQGCDVWLNTPRRPHEACGTSGMKAALNGVLNLSILDGWWDEMFDGTNGWAIPSAERYPDQAQRDAVEASALFDLLEETIVPLFYDRGSDGIPHGWVERIRASMSSLGPQVSAARMLRDYTINLYEPAAARAAVLEADGAARAKALAAWKERVREAWPGVAVEVLGEDGHLADVGTKRDVEAVARLGGLTPEDVEVQLVHGPLDAEFRFREVATVPMEVSGGRASGELRYLGSFGCEQPGSYGFNVRVVPAHADLGAAGELGLVRWARSVRRR